jgi:glutamate/tyrosine decarboxylase-like PLP-dependent enzyme
LDLRAESKTARFNREAEQQTVAALRNELRNEQLSLQHERQRLEYDVKQREKRVTKQEYMADNIWKYAQRDPSKETEVSGVLQNPSMEDVVPPWLRRGIVNVGNQESGRNQ